MTYRLEKSLTNWTRYRLTVFDAWQRGVPMDWNESRAMDGRMRFIIAAAEEDAVMPRVCTAFGMRQAIGYKWLQRYLAGDLDRLRYRSRVSHEHGRASAAKVVMKQEAVRWRRSVGSDCPPDLRRGASGR